MEKTKLIVAIFVIILGALTITQAASASVKFKGEDKIEAEKEQILTIEISNNEAIGVINGIISYDSNIKDVKISSGYNGWMATYNEATGQFNALKAEGETNGEVLQITYKLKEDASQGTITLKDIELTTTSYETIKIEENINKTISKTTEADKSKEDNSQNQNQGQDKQEEDNNNTKPIKNANVTQTASRKPIKKRYTSKNRSNIKYNYWNNNYIINCSSNNII